MSPGIRNVAKASAAVIAVLLLDTALYVSSVLLQFVAYNEDGLGPLAPVRGPLYYHLVAYGSGVAVPAVVLCVAAILAFQPVRQRILFFAGGLLVYLAMHIAASA